MRERKAKLQNGKRFYCSNLFFGMLCKCKNSKCKNGCIKTNEIDLMGKHDTHKNQVKIFVIFALFYIIPFFLIWDHFPDVGDCFWHTLQLSLHLFWCLKTEQVFSTRSILICHKISLYLIRRWSCSGGLHSLKASFFFFTTF